MKKGIGVLMLTFVLLLTVSVGAFAVLPGYEDSVSYDVIATYTLEFLHYDGRSGTGTFNIYGSNRYTDDEKIESVLKGYQFTNLTYVRQITHVSGIPIEQTKWAKYGGINH